MFWLGWEFGQKADHLNTSTEFDYLVKKKQKYVFFRIAVFNSVRHYKLAFCFQIEVVGGYIRYYAIIKIIENEYIPLFTIKFNT